MILYLIKITQHLNIDTVYYLNHTLLEMFIHYCIFQATNLSLSVNELNVTERISQTSSIATALVNITAPTQEPIYAEDINLAVDIVSTLNK